MANGNGNLKAIGIILSVLLIIGMVIGGSFSIFCKASSVVADIAKEKADKIEVCAAEDRCNKRIDELREDLQNSISQFNKKQDDMYKLLLEIAR